MIELSDKEIDCVAGGFINGEAIGAAKRAIIGRRLISIGQRTGNAGMVTAGEAKLASSQPILADHPWLSFLVK